MNLENVEAEVAMVVAAHADVPLERITPKARLWHDLRLAGDDFGDVIENLHRTHGVTLRGRLGDYCPTEGDLYWDFVWWPFKRRRTYRELTIADLAAAVRSGVEVA